MNTDSAAAGNSTHSHAAEKARANKRHWPVAVLLNLVPGAGYLYVGRPGRALIAAGTDLAFQITMWSGLGGWLAKPWAVFVPFGVALVLHIAFLIDAARIARRTHVYELRWYNRPIVYAGVIVAIMGLESLDAIPATGLKSSVSFFAVDGAMAPTLRVGERALADMRAFDTREPRQGEVVVFTANDQTSTFRIRRIIGVPGDRIQMIAGHLHINGKPVMREEIGDDAEIGTSERTTRVQRWRETLPNGVSYIIRSLAHDPNDHRGPYDVPAGHYFMLGDDRSDSRAGREPGELGHVPRANIVGRASWILWSRELARIGVTVR